jgi:hypothetical protein
MPLQHANAVQLHYPTNTPYLLRPAHSTSPLSPVPETTSLDFSVASTAAPAHNPKNAGPRSLSFMNESIRMIAMVLLFGSAFLCAPCRAEDINLASTASPKLRQFVAAHSGAAELLTNALNESFGGKPVRIIYFYSDDESRPRAYPYYPEKSFVGICVRENQEPLDEFASLFYELLDYGGQQNNRECMEKAKYRKISKTDFAREMCRMAFKTAQRTRDLLKKLKLSKQEIAHADEYKRFLGCPDQFVDFLKYCDRINSPSGSLMEFYEALYDTLRPD